ncbi:MAG: DUF493 domain-containing protein [Desulfopila sp.]
MEKSSTGIIRIAPLPSQSEHGIMSTPKSNPPPLEGQPQIEYPCVWQYTVIGRDHERIKAAIEEVCSPIPVTTVYSHSSSSDKYHSYRTEVEVQDEEARLSLYRALHGHTDVQMVI